MKKGLLTLLIIAALLFFAIGSIGHYLGWWVAWWVGSAETTVQEEFSASAMLEKYEWFIDQSNMIEKADSDITIFEQRIASIETQYTSTYGDDKTSWSASVQTQYNHEVQTARDDLVAIVSNRNNIVKEYNAQSEKFNWAPFNTRDDLPPQTYAEYLVKY